MLKKLQAMVELIKKVKVFAFDTETTGVDIMSDFLGISFATYGDHDIDSLYVDVRDLSLEVIKETIRPLFEDKELMVVGHNLKYDWIQLKKLGLDITHNNYFDTMLAYWYIDPGKKGIGLKKLTLGLFGYQMETYNNILSKYGPTKEITSKKGKVKIRKVKAKTLSECTLENVRSYGTADSYWTMKLLDDVMPKLFEYNKTQDFDLLRRIDLPLVRVLVDMELKGVKLDPGYLTELSAQLQKDCSEALKELEQLTNKDGMNINVRSPAQLAQYLFGVLDIPVVRRSPEGGPSTDEETLTLIAGKKEEYPEGAKVCELLLKYRSVFKMLSTYVQALPRVLASDGRIHPNFNIHGTATGRLSCNSPNMQNIPKEGREAKLLREAFVPEKGCVLIRADYQQMEIRMLANESKDPYLTYALRSGKDLHTYTGQKIFQKEVLTDEERGFAKTINFGIIYGMTPYALMNRIGVTLETAQDYINTYFYTYPVVRRWKTKKISDGQRDLKVRNFLGRTRQVGRVGNISNIALNTPVQGGSSDLVKIAMLRLFDRLRMTHAKLILQVHDELLIECPIEEADEVKKLVEGVMESVNLLPEFNWFAMCPFTVDVSVGSKWMGDKDETGTSPELVPEPALMTEAAVSKGVPEKESTKAQGAELKWADDDTDALLNSIGGEK